MPESAVGTGCIDFVLDPTAIAHELLRIGATPTAASAIGQSDAETMDKLFRVLRRVSGVDFASYKQTTIMRRMQRRMFLRRRGDIREYVAFLEADEKEATALSQDVLIHVTSFFRDPLMFDALKERVFPVLFEKREPGAPLRIWVCGCSTGEEVYSIAIAAFEYLAGAGHAIPQLAIFGTDVSATAIDAARTGRYPTSISHDVSKERLEQFFVKGAHGYTIRKDIRDQWHLRETRCRRRSAFFIARSHQLPQCPHLPRRRAPGARALAFSLRVEGEGILGPRHVGERALASGLLVHRQQAEVAYANVRRSERASSLPRNQSG